jgi:hypothetical protein
MLSFEDFKRQKINESAVSEPQEIETSEFPNPITDAMKKIFTKKGSADGEKSDDVVKTVPVSIAAKKLKPSQSAIYLGKALGMAVGGVEGGELGAIISKDNYILDGHHRWAATMFNNPDAIIKGYRSDLNIADLIPVLRALGDAFGNKRRGEPKGGDVNIFKAKPQDALASLEQGKNMNPKFYDEKKSKEWLASKGGEKAIQKTLASIHAVVPPQDAPPRSEMPVIDADKGEEKKVAKLLNKGKIDVRKPYA